MHGIDSGGEETAKACSGQDYAAGLNCGDHPKSADIQGNGDVGLHKFLQRVGDLLPKRDSYGCADGGSGQQNSYGAQHHMPYPADMAGTHGIHAGQRCAFPSGEEEQKERHDDQIDHDADADKKSLLEGRGTKGRGIPGGTVDQNQTEDAGDQAESQKKQIAPAKKFPQVAFFSILRIMCMRWK